MDGDLVFPTDVASRMNRILVEDIDSRVKALTEIVVLQEKELAILSVVLLATLLYIVGKEYRGRR